MVFDDPLTFISYFSNFFAVGIGLFNYKRLNQAQKFVCLLLIILILFELLNLVFFIPVLKTNRVLFWSYTIPEFILIALAYGSSFSSRTLKKTTIAFCLCFTIFIIFDIVFVLKSTDLNSLARSIEALLLITLALLYLRQLLDELRVVKLSRHPMFWVTVGVLVYFPGTFLLFATHNWFSMRLPTSVHYQIWAINDIANIIFNLFIAVALWLPPDQPQSPTSAPL